MLFAESDLVAIFKLILEIVTVLSAMIAAMVALLAKIRAEEVKEDVKDLRIVVDGRLTELLRVSTEAAMLEGKAAGTLTEQSRTAAVQQIAAAAAATTAAATAPSTIVVTPPYAVGIGQQIEAIPEKTAAKVVEKIDEREGQPREEGRT